MALLVQGKKLLLHVCAPTGALLRVLGSGKGCKLHGGFVYARGQPVALSRPRGLLHQTLGGEQVARGIAANIVCVGRKGVQALRPTAGGLKPWQQAARPALHPLLARQWYELGKGQQHHALGGVGMGVLQVLRYAREDGLPLHRGVAPQIGLGVGGAVFLYLVGYLMQLCAILGCLMPFCVACSRVVLTAGWQAMQAAFRRAGAVRRRRCAGQCVRWLVA